MTNSFCLNRSRTAAAIWRAPMSVGLQGKKLLCICRNYNVCISYSKHILPDCKVENAWFKLFPLLSPVYVKHPPAGLLWEEGHPPPALPREPPYIFGRAQVLQLACIPLQSYFVVEFFTRWVQSSRNPIRASSLRLEP
jgi:hypothetical protein